MNQRDKVIIEKIIIYCERIHNTLIHINLNAKYL